MTKPDLTIQPSPYFYDVWGGLMQARGLAIGDWAKEQGVAYGSLRVMASGASNGARSKEIRSRMIAAVGAEDFSRLHRHRLAEAGMAA